VSHHTTTDDRSGPPTPRAPLAVLLIEDSPLIRRSLT